MRAIQFFWSWASYLWILPLAAVLSHCTSPSVTIPPGPKEVRFGHDNYIRDVVFHIPKKLKKRRRSLVLCLHEEGGDPLSITRITRRGFNQLSELNNFIVGYPVALNGYWNDAREDSISLSHYEEIDDVGFIDKTIQFALDSFGIDKERIYVAGFSNGGLMSLRLACERSSRIKGFATVAASLSLDQLVECNPDTTVSLLMINGTRDEISPFEGGQMMLDGEQRGSVLSTEEAINYWLEENGCRNAPIKRDISNDDTYDETRSEKIIYKSCKDDSQIVLIKVSNGGHAWPGGRQYMSEKSAGKVSGDFDASEEIWNFFEGL